MTDAPLEEHREAYRLTVPTSVLAKHMREEYEQDFGGHESDFLLAARRIRMAIEAGGRGVSAEAWATMNQRFKGRLSPSQFASLREMAADVGRAWCRVSPPWRRSPPKPYARSCGSASSEMRGGAAAWEGIHCWIARA